MSPQKLFHNLKNNYLFRSALSEGVLADIHAKVKIGKVFGGYFNSSQNAKIFAEIGISPYISQLPQDIKLADFGGAEGFLTNVVKKYLEGFGKQVEGIVVDANPNYLRDANKRGFITLESPLEEAKLHNFDLIIMRAVLHYNSKAEQKKILQKVKTALNPDGVFVHQLSSGDKYNVELRNKISQLPSLQRTNKPGAINFMTEEDYISLCESINLPAKLIGYAPKDSWTMEEMFDRFHPEVKTMTQEEKINYPRRNLFLQEGKELALYYLNNSTIKGVEKENKTFRVWHTYPIFTSLLSNDK